MTANVVLRSIWIIAKRCPASHIHMIEVKFVAEKSQTLFLNAKPCRCLVCTSHTCHSVPVRTCFARWCPHFTEGMALPRRIEQKRPWRAGTPHPHPNTPHHHHHFCPNICCCLVYKSQTCRSAPCFSLCMSGESADGTHATGALALGSS